MDVAATLILLAYVVGLIVCTVICVQKGKGTMALVGWLLCSPVVYVGAIRLAKPWSSWAYRYGREPWKMEEAERRFNTPPARIREQIAKKQAKLEAENAALKAQLAELP